MASTRSTVATPRTAPADRREHAPGRLLTCTCGQSYRVAGVDRHRIYWPLGAPPDAPVLDGCCARCGRPLPGKQPHCLEQP